MQRRRCFQHLSFQTCPAASPQGSSGSTWHHLPGGQQCPAHRQVLDAGTRLQHGGVSTHLQGGGECAGERVKMTISFSIGGASSSPHPPLLRGPTSHAGQASTSSSGGSTTCQLVQPPTCCGWMTCWRPCRCPHTSVKSCSTLRFWARRTSGQCFAVSSPRVDLCYCGFLIFEVYWATFTTCFSLRSTFQFLSDPLSSSTVE